MWFDEECETMMRYAEIKQTLVDNFHTKEEKAELIKELDAIVRKMVKPKQAPKTVYPLMNNKQKPKTEGKTLG